MYQEILRIINFILMNFLEVWPLILLTIPLALIIQEVGIAKNIHHYLTKNILLAIILGTLIGAIAPFCSCSVIPVISSLLIAGVPLGPIMAFWLASPSMDPEIFFLSVASLGWPLAVARLSATFLMSLSGGLITHYLVVKKWLNPLSVIKKDPPKINVVSPVKRMKDLMTQKASLP